MRSVRGFCLFLVCLFGLTSTAHAALLFDGTSLGDFEVNGAAGTFTETADPMGSGQTVFKTTVKNTDLGPFSNPRTEAATPEFIEGGDDFWLRTKILVPSSFPTLSSGAMELATIYGAPYEGSAPWILETQGETLFWQRNENYGYDIPFNVPLEREKWIGILLHERFDEEGEGFVEMWLNGEQLTFFGPGSYNPSHHAETTRLVMATMDSSNNGGPNFAKLIQTRPLGSAETATVYFGPLKIGETRADVSERRFTGIKVEDFPEVIEQAPGGISEVSDPLGSGEPALALTVHNEDAVKDCEAHGVEPEACNPNPRAQLGSEDEFAKGEEFWAYTKFLVPESYPAITSGWVTLASVYGPPYGGPGPVHLAITEEELRWERNETYGFDKPFSQPLERGKWTTFLLHERLDEEGKGFVEMWLNGKPITFFEPGTYNPSNHPETTKLMMSTMDSTNNGGPNNVRIEQYREFGMFEVGTIYFGPLRIGMTREDVDF